jgi:putative membrane protein
MPSQGQQQPQQQQQRPGGINPGGENPNGPDTATAHVDDKKFVKDAAEGGMMEVELGKMAASKGASDGVKQFGQKMVDDHSKANDQLKEVASKEGMEIPSAIGSKKQAHIDKLSKLDGEAFDKAYVKDMVKDHETDVHEFQVEAQNGTNPNVKQFAASTLPTLQEHLNMIKDLSKKEKGK